MMEKISICHISDLHFGLFENKSYHEIDHDFRIVNSFIEFITTDFREEEKPHFLLISGDITSISDDTEYKEFLDFIDDIISEKCLGRFIKLVIS